MTGRDALSGGPGFAYLDEDYDRVNTGGLMRCCTSTLAELYPDGPAKVATQGQTLQCKYTNDPVHQMIFEDGVWRWHH